MASNHAQKRRCLSIDDKVHIIDAVEKGERKKDVAARFGIPASSLSTILKRKNTILEAAAVGPSATRKRNRTAVYDDVDKATFAWFMEMLSQRVPLSGAVLQRQAVNFANILGCDSFKASSGWLDKFKKRHAIVSKVLCGESASADIVGAATWQEEELRDILERYAAEDIYNADESALFFQMLPGRTLALKGQRCEGGKQSKQRLSILFCVNMDGSDKRVPLVIGKSKNPRCFKGKRIPVTYRSNGKAWMSRAVFKEWLLDFDREMSRKGRHVCLLLDNCSAHHVEDANPTNVEVRFFPPNCTSLIQPLDQGIIRSVKSAYRARLIDKLLVDMRLKRETKVDTIQAVEMLAASWQSTGRDVIVNSFRKAGFTSAIGSTSGDSELSEPCANNNVDDEFALPEIEQQWDTLRVEGGVPDDVELQDFLYADSCAACTEELCEEDIVASLQGTNCSSGDESDDAEEVCVVPSVNEVLDAIALLRRYAASQENQEVAIAALTTYERHVTPTFFNTIQTRVTDFFVKK